MRRQPFGGWKRSAVGPGTKAGGPNYLVGLTGWEPAPSTGVGRRSIDPAVRRAARRAARGALDAATELDVVDARALRSDAAAWAPTFGTAADVSGLAAERNVLRYLAAPGRPSGSRRARPPADLVRVVAAGRAGRGADAWSRSPRRCPSARRQAVAAVARAASRTTQPGCAGPRRGGGRVRLIGGPARAGRDATGGRPDLAVWAGPVTEAGRIELLPFLREQAVSITAHRFGTPDHLTDGLL